jgi:SAM-dependent methyltransferase
MIIRWLTDLLHERILRSVPPEGPEGIAILGHRGYVGGRWDEIGQLQLDFLVEQGLSPQSVLLDVGCGSLRLGAKAIPLLEPGHYLAIEKEEGLVRAGLAREIDPRVLAEKRPEIVISSGFEFERLSRRADLAIAQSLFTHLPADRIRLCFGRLRRALVADGRFYATFLETERPVDNPHEPHDHRPFRYTSAEMLAFGEEADFTARYLGAWNHPRGQVMVEYRSRPADARG